MIADRDLEAAVRSWLRSEADDRAPDRVFEAIFATTSTRRQARPLPAWMPRPEARAGVLAWVGLAALLATAIVSGAIIVGAVRGPEQRLSTPRPAAATLVANTCSHPSALIPLTASVWVSCLDQARRYDAMTDQVDGALETSVIAADDLGIWIARGDLVEAVDVTTLSAGKTVPLANVRALALDADSVWALQSSPDRLVRVDRQSGAVAATVPLDGAPGAIVAAAGSAWVSLPDLGRVDRFGAAGELLTSIQVAKPTSLSVEAGNLWVLAKADGAITVIDGAGNATSRRAFAPGAGIPLALALGADSAWEVGDREADETGVSTDAVTQRLSLALPGDASVVAAAIVKGRLFLLDGQGNRLFSVTP